MTMGLPSDEDESVQPRNPLYSLFLPASYISWPEQGEIPKLNVDGQDNTIVIVALLFSGQKLIALKGGIILSLPTDNPRRVLFVKVVNKKWTEHFHPFERPHVALSLGPDALSKQITSSGLFILKNSILRRVFLISVRHVQISTL
jgi:hypothetical protein